MRLRIHLLLLLVMLSSFVGSAEAQRSGVRLPIAGLGEIDANEAVTVFSAYYVDDARQGLVLFDNATRSYRLLVARDLSIETPALVGASKDALLFTTRLPRRSPTEEDRRRYRRNEDPHSLIRCDLVVRSCRKIFDFHQMIKSPRLVRDGVYAFVSSPVSLGSQSTFGENVFRVAHDLYVYDERTTALLRVTRLNLPSATLVGVSPDGYFLMTAANAPPSEGTRDEFRRLGVSNDVSGLQLARGFRLFYRDPFLVSSVCFECEDRPNLPSGHIALISANLTTGLAIYRRFTEAGWPYALYDPQQKALLSLKPTLPNLRGMSVGIPLSSDRIDYYELTESFHRLISYDVRKSEYIIRGEVAIPMDRTKVPVIELDTVMQ